MKSNQITSNGTAPTLAVFKTMAIYISGGICGKIWMPAVQCGKPLRNNARGPWGFYQDGDSFRDALNGLLMREGGDFQNPLFTADTVLRIERRSVQGAGKYTMHIWEREISALPDCANLVDADAFTGDFLGEE